MKNSFYVIVCIFLFVSALYSQDFQNPGYQSFSINNVTPPSGCSQYPVIESYIARSWGSTYPTELYFLKPSGVVSDNLLIIIVASDNNDGGEVFNTVSGWSKLGEGGDYSADTHIAVYYRVSDGTEPDSTLVTSSFSDHTFGWYLNISCVNTITPINASNFTQSSSSSNVHNIPEVTTDEANTLILFGLSFDGGTADPFSVSGTGFILEDEQDAQNDFSGTSGCFGYKELNSIGGSGTAQINCSASDGAAYFQLAINPTY